MSEGLQTNYTAEQEDEDDEDDEGGKCGWWKLQPNSFQKYRTAKWALLFLCFASALQGMIVNGFINVVITTIERRFGMRSKESGFIAGSYDIASFFCLIPVSYFGGRKGASKPRWLGWGVLLMGLGSLVFTIPHFIAGPLQHLSNNEHEICLLNKTTNSSENSCNIPQKPLNGNAMWFFLIGQLLHGAGSAPLFTLGVTFIDENVSKKMSSVYLGVFYTVAIIGPALGFVIGGQLLRIYTDFLYVNPTELGLTADSNVWVGAWWIGFLFSAVLSIFVAIPLLAFPAVLPGANAIQKKRVSEAYYHKDEDDDTPTRMNPATKLNELPNSVKRLLSNPTFIFLSLAGTTECLLIAGFAAFLPKLIENQFSVNVTKAALIMGAVTVPAGGSGTFLGGYLVKKLALSCSGIIKLCRLTAFFALICTLGFFINCPNTPLAGVNTGYDNSFTLSNNSSNIGLLSTCNEDCSCSSQVYDPICGVDNIMYYSPCYAACTVEKLHQNTKVYNDCKCIKDVNSTNDFKAVNQMCQSTCNKMWLFIILIFMAMFFTFLTTMPSLAATLRCVEDSQKSFALGVQWLKVRILGTIPAPILFGTLIDESCILWQQDEICNSNEKGSCRVYDNALMSWYMVILAFSVKLGTVIFFTIAHWTYKPPPTATIKPYCSTDENITDSKNIPESHNMSSLVQSTFIDSEKQIQTNTNNTEL